VVEGGGAADVAGAVVAGAEVVEGLVVEGGGAADVAGAVVAGAEVVEGGRTVNISTVSKLPLIPAKRISNQQHQQQQHISPLPHALPLPIRHPPPITDIKTRDAPWPPANIASPSFGSDVAARLYRATLRAAVVHTPLVALKMSTVL
jgi:hypothetical protein